MSEETALAKARQLVNEGNEAEAVKLLCPLCESKNRLTALNAIFVLLDALNPITENDKLLSLAEKGIEVASYLGQSDAKAYLLSKKVFYLLNELSRIVARAGSLVLSARVFRWIEFSLERDKEEYDAIAKHRVSLEATIALTAAEVEAIAEACPDHGMRGQCAFRRMTDTIPSRWRTPFRRHGGQCSDDMADTLTGGSERCPP